MNTHEESTGTQNKLPLVTVIIPAYNTEAYIRRSVMSALNQDLPGRALEVLVVDDGSTDATSTILAEIESRHSQLKTLRIPNSGSAAQPRNIGVENAQGEFIFFLDADDWIEPDALRAAIRAAETDDVDIVMLKLGGENREVPHIMFRETQHGVDYIDSLAYRTLSVLKLYRRSLFFRDGMRFPLNFRRGEDESVALQAFINSPRISILADKVYYWATGREDGSNITRTVHTATEGLHRFRRYVDTVLRSEESGERLQLLFRRTMTDVQILHRVFGPRFTVDLESQERRQIFEYAQAHYVPYITSHVRQWGNVQRRIVFDVLQENDLLALENTSAHLRRSGSVLHYNESHSDLVYESSTGRVYGGYNPRAVLGLIHWKVSAGVVTCSIHWTSPDTLEPPSRTILTLQTQSSTKESLKCPIVTERSSQEGRENISVFQIDLAKLRTTGDWHFNLQISWGETKRNLRLVAPDRNLNLAQRDANTMREHGVLLLAEASTIVMIKRRSAFDLPIQRPLEIQGSSLKSLLPFGFWRRVTVVGNLTSARSIRIANKNAQRVPIVRSISGKKQRVSVSIPRWAQIIEILDIYGTPVWRQELEPVSLRRSA